jgi:hypothetical protein
VSTGQVKSYLRRQKIDCDLIMRTDVEPVLLITLGAAGVQPQMAADDQSMNFLQATFEECRKSHFNCHGYNAFGLSRLLRVGS